MNFRGKKEDVATSGNAARTGGIARGPLAGTSYDFRELFPNLVTPPAPKVDSRASRRAFFRDFTPKKRKP